MFFKHRSGGCSKTANAHTYEVYGFLATDRDGFVRDGFATRDAANRFVDKMIDRHGLQVETSDFDTKHVNCIVCEDGSRFTVARI